MQASTPTRIPFAGMECTYMANEADRRALMDAVIPGSFESQQRAQAEEVAGNAAIVLSQDATMDKFRLDKPDPRFDKKPSPIADATTSGTLPLLRNGNTEYGLAFGHKKFDTDGDYSEAAPNRPPHRHGRVGGVYVSWKF